MDTLYELKKELYEMITNSELPIEVQLFENMTKRKLKQICENYHVLNTAIEQYIETKFAAIRPYMKRIQEQKNNQDFEKIVSAITEIGLKIKEVSENSRAFDEEEMTDSQFLEKSNQRISLINMKEENSNATRNIVGLVIDTLADIRNSIINRTLEINEDKKEEFSYEISQFKNYIESQIPQEMERSFDKNDQRLLQEVSKKFEKYFYIEKNNKDNNEKDKQDDSFRKELDAGISLEQQSKNAKMFMDKQNEDNEERKSKGLPDNVIQ